MKTSGTRKTHLFIPESILRHALYKGRLLARVPEGGAALASTVMRVAQGALRVADLWFTLRTRAVESVSDEVEEFLGERNIRFERGESLVGRSGRTWRVDFHTRTPRRSSLVYVLSSGSRASARGIAEHVLASWCDLNFLKIGPESLRFVSLFDDTMDVWSVEDFKSLEDLSSLVRWSRPDEFADLLVA